MSLYGCWKKSISILFSIWSPVIECFCWHCCACFVASEHSTLLNRRHRKAFCRQKEQKSRGPPFGTQYVVCLSKLAFIFCTRRPHTFTLSVIFCSVWLQNTQRKFKTVVDHFSLADYLGFWHLAFWVILRDPLIFSISAVRNSDISELDI